MISFSTQPGNVALDGTGRNSPYTGPLVKKIGRPGEDVLTVLTEVRNEVLAATSEKQVPWENHALRARFYFNPSAPASPEASEAGRTWAWIKNTTDQSMLENFINRFGDTAYGAEARAQLEELKKRQATTLAPVNPPSAAAVPQPIGELLVPARLTSKQIVSLLWQNDLLAGEVKLTPREGSLLPDTYPVPSGATRELMIHLMQEAQGRVLQEMWEQRGPDIPLGTPDQLITLASIVEKECTRPEDYPRVAAVLLNRLLRRMKLQSNQTVVYGLAGGKGHLGRPIVLNDIRQVTPYNTYLIAGLPPGPIGNPSREAIMATTYPARTRDLFFITDAKGDLLFAETLEQHQKNVSPATVGGHGPWSWVQNTADPGVLEDFLKDFPDSSFGAMAYVRLQELRKQRIPSTPPKKAASVVPAAKAKLASTQPREVQKAYEVLDLDYSEWTKVCRKEDDKRVCATTNEATSKSGDLAVSASLVEQDGTTRKLLNVAVPLGMQVQAGTRIVIDNGEPEAQPYSGCYQNGCIASYEASAALIGKLRTGQTLFVHTMTMDGRALSHPLPLAGFAPAYDGPPTDPKVLEEQQQKRQLEWQHQADAARKQRDKQKQ